VEASTINADGTRSWEDLFDALRPVNPALRHEHDQWRQRVRGFVDTRINPFLADWERASTFPDDLYLRAVEDEIFGLGFPKEVGGSGTDTDIHHRIIFAEEMHRQGSGLVFADLATHWVGLPPVIDAGVAELRRHIVEPVLAGEKRICFAVTEPSGGSDVANLTTQAERCGDVFRLRGTKTLISGAMRADFALVIARTGGSGMRGLSLFVVDLNQPGVTRQPVPGLEWYNRNVGTLQFADAEVPMEGLLGRENQGFAMLSGQLDIERLSGIGAMLALSRYCLAQAAVYCRQREAFGKALADHQVLRHRLVEMHRSVRSAYCFLDYCVGQVEAGARMGADLALLKITACRALDLCAREAMQMLGGSVYCGSNRVERVFRESRIFALAGGTEEILSEMAARQLQL